MEIIFRILRPLFIMLIETKKDCCDYFCRNIERFRGFGKYHERTVIMPWAYDTASMFHDLFYAGWKETMIQG